MKCPAIDLDQLVVQYGRFVAVDRLSLTVGEGELFGFLGPNGAGKTSTIRVLTGLLRPSSGSVRVLGYPLPERFEEVTPLFGFVPDTDNHLEELTGRENLEIFARLYDLPSARVEVCLKTLELAEAADLRVRDYSKGMRKKLLLAREILHEPKVLYLDEPTANLDVHSTELVRELLRELAQRGATLFLTTHNMQEVEEICDRVAILCRGQLVDCDTPTNFVTRHAQRIVKAQFERDGRSVRESLNLDEPSERQRLVAIVEQEHGVRVHSQEFDFHDVFLKLTGQAYL